VRAEASFSLGGCRGEVAAEWSALRKHDCVFLLTLEATLADGARATDAARGVPFPQHIGLTAVRGAEVVQVSDEQGNVFTGESENDAQLRGNARKLELSLDPSQYHVDAQAMAEGRGGDVYASFNLIVRRELIN